MVQILEENRKPSTGELFSKAFANASQQAGQGVGQFLQGQQAQKMRMGQQQDTAKMLSDLTGKQFTGREDPELLKALATQYMKNQGKEQLWDRKQDFLGNLMGGQQGEQGQMMQEPDEMGMQQPAQGRLNPAKYTPEQIMQANIVDPNIGRAMQHANDTALREQREERDIKRKTFEGDRDFHSKYSMPEEKKVSDLRESLPKKEMALNFARDAVENGDVSYFSLDKLADATGSDLFRTAKGAQLSAAGKENLISNLSKVSAKAQNQWLEQRMNSVFPKIGQSEEANLTVQEMIEAEMAMDNAYIREFDRLSEQDQKEYGFVKKDIGKRAHDAVKSKNNEIMRRSSYRIKEIEESTNFAAKNRVGKNVPKGTPLTKKMAKHYKDKFGDKALSVAEKNGYYVPSFEEFELYEMRPMEYGETNDF